MSDEALIAWAREDAAPAARQRPRSATLRRRPAGTPRRVDELAVEVHDSIESIEPAVWNALIDDDDVTRSHAYLRAVERAAITDCRYFYILVRGADGAAVAHAVVYVVATDFVRLMPRIVQAVTSVVRKIWPRLLRADIVECARPLVSGNSIAVRPGGDHRAVVDAVERAMVDLGERLGAHLMVLRDFTAGEAKSLDFLSTRGYKCVANLPLSRIEIRWPSYEAYLGAMRRRYRKDLKRCLRRAEQAGYSVQVEHDFGACSELWARQVGCVYEASCGFKRETVNAAYYEQMAALDDGEAHLLVLRKCGRKVAHGMLLCGDRTTVATFFGRESEQPDGEWFLLLNAAVRFAIERGSRQIELGLGSYEAKSLFGAEAEPLYVFTRSRIAWLNALIKLVPDLMRRDAPRCHRVFPSTDDPVPGRRQRLTRG